MRTRFRRSMSDPGEAWAREVLEPLRRRQAECDVAPAVMARIAAARPRSSRPLPFLAQRPRLAWAAGFLAGGASLALVTGALRGAAERGPAAREALGAAASFGRIAILLGRFLVAAYGRTLEVAAPFVRAVWTLLEIMAPLVRGAGVAAAAFGALSILISLYIFTHARAAAPAAGGGRHP